MKPGIENMISDDNFAMLLEYFADHYDNPDIRNDYREKPECISRVLLAVLAMQEGQMEQLLAKNTRLEHTIVERIKDLEKCNESLQGLVNKLMLQLQIRDMALLNEDDDFPLQ